jgi:hypothetical protein
VPSGDAAKADDLGVDTVEVDETVDVPFPEELHPPLEQLPTVRGAMVRHARRRRISERRDTTGVDPRTMDEMADFARCLRVAIRRG